jgi:lipopolysaccharide export system protein LptA
VLAVLGATTARSSGEQARAVPPLPAATNATPGAESLLGGFSFTSNREPISINADAMEFDYRSRVLTYKGGVVATQGNLKLESVSLTVTLDAQVENRVKEVVADSHVRISQGTRWATGGHAVFDQDHNTVVLSQAAELHDGPNVVKGDRVVVYLNEERSVIEGGGGRVNAVLFPSQRSVITPTPSPKGITP